MEQLSGVMSMSKEAASARTGTLHFLALHAFFTVDAASVKKVNLSSLIGRNTFYLTLLFTCFLDFFQAQIKSRL